MHVFVTMNDQKDTQLFFRDRIYYFEILFDVQNIQLCKCPEVHLSFAEGKMTLLRGKTTKYHKVLK